MHRKKLFIVSTVLLISLIVGSYYFFTQKSKSSNRHGHGTKQLSCSDSVVFSLRLKRNDNLVWKKTHDELFNLPEAIPSTDKRFLDKDVMPLLALLKNQPKFTSIEVIPCDDNNITLNYAQIKNSKDFYYLSQNNKNRMKLLKQQNRYDRITVKRNVIDINLID